MHKIYALLFAPLLILIGSSSARASSDNSCEFAWMLDRVDLGPCVNIAMLSPQNDTRVNLFMLMGNAPPDTRAQQDRPSLEPLFGWQDFAEHFPVPPGTPAADGRYAEGEGSRCRSNDTGRSGFETAINDASGVTPDERAALIAARRGLAPSCVGEGSAAVPITEIAGRMHSSGGKDFARYLEGAAAFYAGDFDTASADFDALRSTRQPWLRETARYMVARTEVNRAQIGVFDDYGAMKEGAAVAQKTIAGEAALRQYLKEYPHGAYALSAQGLLRRAYWLGNDTAKMTREYAALFAQPAGARGVDDVSLALEVDAKMLPRLKIGTTTDPVLLAILDLVAMRAPMALQQLESQRRTFASNPALFEYLLAVHAYYIAKQPGEVLRLLPDRSQQSAFSYLDFSRQMLRGMALEATRDAQAGAFWKRMLPGATRPYQYPAIELALALNEERSQGLDRIFETGSPIYNPRLRDTLLAHVAGAALLRRQAKAVSATPHERSLALFILLYKDATRGAYADFLQDIALIPTLPKADKNNSIYGLFEAGNAPLGIFTQTKTLGDYGCVALRTTVAQLAQDPRSASGQLCLAEFMRANDFDDRALDARPSRDELGGTPPRFAGRPYSRLDTYIAVIADPAAPAKDKAYALYRAVNCYAPSGTNSCGGAGVPVAQRKAWFRRLKTDFPTSVWAPTLDYYW